MLRAYAEYRWVRRNQRSAWHPRRADERGFAVRHNTTRDSIGHPREELSRTRQIELGQAGEKEKCNLSNGRPLGDGIALTYRICSLA
jgi:hypothetical protein